MIKEFDRVALTRALPEHHLETGDVGTVVMVHTVPVAGFTIEFTTFSGKMIALVDLTADAVRPIRAREIAHVREVA